MNQVINLDNVQKYPLKYLPKKFLDSKRVNTAMKTIRQELMILKEYSENKTSYARLAQKYGFSIKMIYRIMKRWGKSYPPDLDKVFRLDNKSTQSILQDLKICRAYFDGNSIYTTAKIFNLTPKGVQGIVERYGFNLRDSYKASLILHNKKELKFPLTRYVPQLIVNGFKNFFPHIISSMTLTDGCLYPSEKDALKVRRPKLFYCGDKELCKIYADLIYFYYHLNPSFFKQRKDGTFLVLYERKDNRGMVKELLRLSPNYKTSLAHGEKIDHYLKKYQPTLKFLDNIPNKILIEIFRLAMSAEGSCSVYFSKQKLKFDLGFSCAHPILMHQWKELACKIGIEFHYNTTKGWFNYSGLSTSKLSNIKRFLELGGFSEGVKITNQSPYYAGIEKNKLSKNVFKWLSRKREVPANLTTKEKHKIFKDFIKSRLRKND